MSPLDREVEAYRRKRDATLRPILEPLVRAGLTGELLEAAVIVSATAGLLRPYLARELADRVRRTGRLH